MSFFHSRKGFVTAAIAIFLVMMGIGALLGGKLNTLFFSSVQTKALTGKPINILFMGIDARDTKSNSRSDTMILASIDPGTDKVVMVSIPRDTRIKNSAGKYDKINSINMVDGPEAACDKVGELLNVTVDYYVITNFAGFGDIVDALGGVAGGHPHRSPGRHIALSGARSVGVHLVLVTEGVARAHEVDAWRQTGDEVRPVGGRDSGRRQRRCGRVHLHGDA